MDIQEILTILPHRHPFLLVDRIIELVPDQKIVGLKNVTMNEPFFQGHFPNAPIMPGVLIIEAMAQVSLILASKSNKGEKGDIGFLAGVDNAKFRSPIMPGDQMILTAELTKVRLPFLRFKGQCHVDGKLRCEAEILSVIQKGGSAVKGKEQS
ncbi:MAG: 3-hydroxyacyl-ACP dehydratase FabZ [Nitrospirota bacterium]